jgi:copper resistance protein C
MNARTRSTRLRGTRLRETRRPGTQLCRMQLRRTRLRRRGPRAAAGAIILLIAALVIIPATSASAHDYLVDSSPEPNSVQTTPIHKVRLTFDDIVLNLSHDGSSALLQVTGPNAAQRHFETGCPTILDRDVTAPVALGGPGKYTVTWQIVSADGHTVSNSIVFTYRPPAGAPEAKGTTSRPVCGKNGDGASTQAAVPITPTQTNDSGNLGLVVGIGVGIGVLAIGAVVVIIVTSRRKTPALQAESASEPQPPQPRE